MNNSAFTFKRLIALLLLVVMSLSMVACDMLPLDDIFGNDEPEHVIPEEGECQHELVIDGECINCGHLFIHTVDELSIDKYTGSQLPDGSVTSELYYVKATVKQVLNDSTGEMIIEDETGSIRVKAIFTGAGTAYGKMFEKPDEYDEVTLHCTLEKVGGIWQVKHAFLISFEAVEAPVKVLTVAEALELCGEPGNLTTERYYVRGTVKTVTNPAYGAMVIYDETGEISVYGTYSEDGSVGYADMAEKPVKGDQVLLYCTLQNYNGTKEIKNAWLIEFEHVDVPFDESKYTEMSIADAREAELGTLVKVSGVVAQITYANGYKPSGVILVDGTSSIYVYDGDLAGQVKIGNTVSIAAEKTYWILDSEIGNAEKFGYKGACQLDGAYIISNDNGNTEFDKSWIEETTVKEIMDTPVTENITNKIFKTTALVKKAPGNGFVNYYINDLDGITGSYVYTQCNGGDFSWLDEFDGKFCTVYFVAINAKSSSSGCLWRFLPISVSDDGYVFDTNKAAEFAVKYHGVVQFLAEYTGDPAIELVTSVSSELLGFEGATLAYSSSNESVVYFTTDENGALIFHCGEAGSADITVTGTHNGNIYTESVTVTVKENVEVDSITVADAIATPFDTDVVVKGIVGPSLVNRTGFYLFGEDGSMIAVLVSEDAFEGLAIGHEIIVSGMRERFIKDDTYTTYGQDAIVNGEIIANYYGNHAYSTEKFITDKTLADIKALDVTESHSTEVYVVKAVVEVVETTYYTNLKITYNGAELALYCSSASQYNWLKAYAGQEITMEIAPCNWNDKKDAYRGCVLAVVLEDGTKVLNTLNFN